MYYRYSAFYVGRKKNFSHFPSLGLIIAIETYNEITCAICAVAKLLFSVLHQTSHFHYLSTLALSIIQANMLHLLREL